MKLADQETKRIQYPLDSSSYKILDEIGVGVSAVVYKAICIPMNSTVVAIKAIDLDKSRADFDNVRREIKTMSLLSHPNILEAHCSFTVDRRLWVVMPFMSGGSLQSIISSSFPDGLSEPCIAIVLKEILNALSYLHKQGHLHRDIKAGNILIDSNGHVKLADFGVSASIYESTTGQALGSSSFCSRLMLTDVAGTPYWMAPEVIHSHTGYSFKADIWSFGITALELAHGCPPLSHLPPSKSLLMKITKRFRFSDYEKHKKDKSKKFSKAFKDMVASCLDQDPAKRPSAEKLLKHSFFKNCKGSEYLAKHVLQGLPSVEERFREGKVLYGTTTKTAGGNNEEDDETMEINVVKVRRISGWNFNEEGFELDPIFPTEIKDDSVMKKVRFGGETFIQPKKTECSQSSDSGESSHSSPARLGEDEEEIARACKGSDNTQSGENFNVDLVVGGLVNLKKSLDVQKQNVNKIIDMFGGDQMKTEERLMQVNENLNTQLMNERQKNFELEMELQFLKLLISGASSEAKVAD